MSEGRSIRMAEMKNTKIGEIKVGQVFAYNGDHVPYKSKFLHSRGKKTGNWLLPCFNETDADKRDWWDSPGSASDEYKVVAIETNRKGKNGRDLDDLVACA